jgi:hypothetical protein
LFASKELYMTITRFTLCALTAVFATATQAEPVRYTFEGLLSGDYISGPFTRLSFADLPFSVSIAGDTSNVSSPGSVPGLGRAWTVPGTSATWSIGNLVTGNAVRAQVYAIPGIGGVGFGWGGDVFPVSSPSPADLVIAFNGNAIALDDNYGRLTNVVPLTDIFLRTALQNIGAIPEYSTYVNFSDQGSVLLRNFSSVKYSVVSAVPVPSSVTLLGIGALLFMARTFRALKPACPMSN